MEAIPTVDIAAWAAPELHSDAERRATAAEWNDAMSTIGFGVVSGHGVGLELKRWKQQVRPCRLPSSCENYTAKALSASTFGSASRSVERMKKWP